jgi:two-component system, sensor histidine kinase
VQERALIWAAGRDGPLTCEFLKEAGHEAYACASCPQLCQELQRGAGVLILAAEFLSDPGISALSRLLAEQPPWSDIPLIIIAGHATRGKAPARLRAEFGGASVLHRPLSLDTLYSTVEAGLRARRRQYQVRDLLQQREDAERRREEFLAMLAHELRNPLAPIRTGLQVLRLTESRDTAERTRQMIERQVANLSRLIDDLLEVSRITRGRISLQKQTVDVAETLRAVAESRARIAAEKGLRIHTQLAGGPLLVSADPVRLEQMFDNVLANSIKFTPASGSIDIGVSREGPEIVTRIKDTGIGIPAAMLGRVFDLFAQAERPLDRSHGGLGIGLTVVKTLAELHGGSVSAASEGEGRGAEVVIRLPADDHAKVGQPQLHNPQLDGERPRNVLIVEDNRDAADVLATYLRARGHFVRVAYDGGEGLSAALRERPEVVICDIGLPGMDGYELARVMRAHPALNRCLLVAITGYGEPRDRERGLQAGFQHYVVKPADPQKIATLVLDGGDERAETMARA